jgi:hypothetical protein
MFMYDCSYVYFILHVLSVVVSLIGGVPRMGPRSSPVRTPTVWSPSNKVFETNNV